MSSLITLFLFFTYLVLIVLMYLCLWMCFIFTLCFWSIWFSVYYFLLAPICCGDWVRFRLPTSLDVRLRCRLILWLFPPSQHCYGSDSSAQIQCLCLPSPQTLVVPQFYCPIIVSKHQESKCSMCGERGKRECLISHYVCFLDSMKSNPHFVGVWLHHFSVFGRRGNWMLG